MGNSGPPLGIRGNGDWVMGNGLIQDSALSVMRSPTILSLLLTLPIPFLHKPLPAPEKKE
ncbi:hypothetical protein FDUTEX481_00197 [Tolypothrix sp. PCC 7601]|nr:hypothetical protein FDUTEX481_00197 [Tolypothrix sp. PCC 7601]